MIIYSGDAPKKEIFQIFSDEMEKMIIEDPEVAYIDADLMASMRSKDLWKKYPNNVFNTGIQEANMIGVSAGMYLYGRKVYAHSFAPFATRRCFDQIFESIGYGRKSLRIIGSEPGICATDNGGTHMTFEDIALVRTIPDSTVIDISDGTMFAKMLHLTKDMSGVIYIRTPRRGLCDIYSEDEKFDIGKGKLVAEGSDCTIIASGIMVSTAIKVRKILADENINVEVIDPITIKPLDRQLILDSVMKTKKVVTLENHSIVGGLGGAVCELLAEEYPVKVKRIGIDEQYGQVGNETYLREVYGLSAEIVAEKVKTFLGDCQ